MTFIIFDILYLNQQPKENIKNLKALGNVAGLEKKLQTNFKNGLSNVNESDLKMRVSNFGENKFPEPPYATWFDMFIESFEDQTLIM